jgi:glycosyltransferase involved in cell wall biosynthesis
VDRTPATARPDLIMLTKDITISVVIAARNCEGTIQAAVQSALDQSSPPTEVILVDDMSTDGTRQRARELDDDRIVILTGEGRGVAAARNVGIRAASCAWLAFLDCDDLWLGEFLELARRRIKSSSDAVACFGAATPIDDRGSTVGHHEMSDVVTLEDLAYGRIVPTTSASLVRRDVTLSQGGFFEGIRRAAEDLDLWLRLAEIGACIGIPEAAALYVVHDSRDRDRSADVLAEMESDRETVIDRFEARSANPALVRRARAIMRARTSRYWLRAQRPAAARAAARSSLRAQPTAEGLVTLAFASLPGRLREALVVRRRRYRAARRLRRI